MPEPLLAINNTLKQIFSVMVQSTNRIVTAINRVGAVLAKTSVIGRRLSTSTFGKETGIKTVSAFNEMINSLFGVPKQDQGFGSDNGAKTMAPLQKLQKGIGGMFKSIGKSITASFSPVMLIFQILQPLFTAFLEPLEMLEPLLSSWGTILSQLLVPIMMALMDLLMPITPLLLTIVNALLPIITALLPIIQIFVPIIVFLTQALSSAVNVLAMVANFVALVVQIISGAIAFVSEVLFGFLGNLMGQLSTIFNNIRQLFADGITALSDIIQGWIAKAKQIAIDLYNNTLGVFFGKIQEEGEALNQSVAGYGSGSTKVATQEDSWY